MQPVQAESVSYKAFQLFNKYIVCNSSQGILIIDQQRAHERILYEHYLRSNSQTPLATQQILFPEQIELSAKDFTLMESLLPEFKLLGFDLEVFGKNSFVINGSPTELENVNIVHTIENILESYKLNTIDARLDIHDNLCRSMAKSTAIRSGKALDDSEIQLIIEHLMQCESPSFTADGRTIFMSIEKENIDRHFKK